MISAPSKAGMAALAAFVTAAVLMPLSAASASVQPSVNLNGDWAPFNRCPVDDPTMKQATGDGTIALCLESDSPSGTFKAGNIPVATGETNLQLGVVEEPDFTFTAIQPVGGAVTSAPVDTPGGFQALACPSTTAPLSDLCAEAAANPSLNTVQAIVQDAGNPTNLNVLAGA
ncbi:MAG: hypothetical protein LBV78_23605, partial [Kitasatospora sp.]|nr:hypothetical protein [Kitasatospora sp.]